MDSERLAFIGRMVGHLKKDFQNILLLKRRWPGRRNESLGFDDRHEERDGPVTESDLVTDYGFDSVLGAFTAFQRGCHEISVVVKNLDINGFVDPTSYSLFPHDCGGTMDVRF